MGYLSLSSRDFILWKQLLLKRSVSCFQNVDIEFLWRRYTLCSKVDRPTLLPKKFWAIVNMRRISKIMLWLPKLSRKQRWIIVWDNRRGWGRWFWIRFFSPPKTKPKNYFKLWKWGFRVCPRARTWFQDLFSELDSNSCATDFLCKKLTGSLDDALFANQFIAFFIAFVF